MITVTVVLHSLTSILALYLFILFMWWWIKQGRASKIYNYTAGLMFGIFIQHAGAVRTYLLLPWTEHSDLADFNYWTLRQLFMLAPLIMYAKHATVKIINEKKAVDQMKYDDNRRTHKRRSTDIDHNNGIAK